MNVGFSSPPPVSIARSEEQPLGDADARCPLRCLGAGSYGVIARVSGRFARAITQCAIAATAPLSCSESCTKPSPRSLPLSRAFQGGCECPGSQEPPPRALLCPGSSPIRCSLLRAEVAETHQANSHDGKPPGVQNLGSSYATWCSSGFWEDEEQPRPGASKPPGCGCSLLRAAFEAEHPKQGTSLTHRNLLGKRNPSAAFLAAEVTQAHP